MADRELIQYNNTSGMFENSSNALIFSDRGAGAGGGSTTVASSLAMAIPNPYHSAYTYFWEYAARRIAGFNRIDVAFDSNSQTDGNLYGGVATLWLDKITFLAAGTYYLSAMVHVGENSPSGAYLDAGWTNGSYNSLGPRVRLQRYDEKRIIVRGIYEAAASDVAGLYMYAMNNVYYTQSTYINYLISVEKI